MLENGASAGLRDVVNLIKTEESIRIKFCHDHTVLMSHTLRITKMWRAGFERGSSVDGHG